MSSSGPDDPAPHDAPPGDPPADDPLRLEHCPACGYALEGLAREGVCPECGGAYDQTEVVLHGYGAGSHSNLTTARPRTAVAIGVVFLLFLCWSVRNLTRNGTHEAMDLLAPVVVTCSLAWAIWKRSTADMPGLVQVRLSSRGAIQLDNPGDGRKGVGNPKPWRDIVGVQIRSTGADTVRIKLFSHTTFWRGTDVPVDADVRCAAPEALVERVKAWRSPPPGDKSPRPT